MIQRLLIEQLRQWAQKDGRKPLVLRGARQVGKTTIVGQFAKDFDNYIPINLEREEDVKAFQQSDDVHKILTFICVQKHITIKKGKTLLFIDEIQNSAKAVALLRYFYEEMPGLYVIAAGSRLQSLIKERVSFPVGRVEYMSLRPCSFYEFLGATDNQVLRQMIDSQQIDDLYHQLAADLFNTYALVGGMPEVVTAFIKNQDVSQLAPIYKSLIDGYKDDAEKYAKNQTKANVIRHILQTGWSQAGSCIQFSGFGGSSYGNKEIHEALEMLQKAFLLQLDYPTTSLVVPALPALRRQPKLIWVDNGLVNYSADIQIEYLQNKNLLDTWRGRAAEHIVAQELNILADKYLRNNLMFWVRAKKGTDSEVDFVWIQNSQVIPIEVKTGHNSKLASLHVFMDECPHNFAIRVWNNPFSIDDVRTRNGKQYRLLNIPFYYVGKIDELINKYW